MSAGDAAANSASERIHQPRLADADDGDVVGPVGGEIHAVTPFWRTPRPACSRSRTICRASSVRPRLIRDFTVPSGSSQLVGDFLVGQLLDVAQHHGRPQRRRERFERFASKRYAVVPFEDSVRRWRCARAAPGPPASTSRSIASRSFRALR